MDNFAPRLLEIDPTQAQHTSSPKVGFHDTCEIESVTTKDSSATVGPAPSPRSPRTCTPSSTSTPLQSARWTDHISWTKHVQFFKDTDWSNTSLGPLENWSLALRLHTFTVLADSRPASLYWGPNLVAIYNEAFVPLAGLAHPDLMGASFKDGFPEIWHLIKPVFDMARRTGVAANVEEQEMILQRNDFKEEAYFSGNFTPIRGGTGQVDGFYNATYEITKSRINVRRLAVLEALEVPAVDDTRRLPDHVFPVLKTNPRDFPMALMYKADEESIPGSILLVLRARIGIPDDHPLAVEHGDLSSDDGLMPLLRQAKRKIVTVPVDERFNGVKWAGFGEASKFVSILPVSNLGRLFGFLVLGTNPRRPMDADHHQFMRDISANVSAIAACIISAEESRKRQNRLEREIASKQRQMQYMAENASIGMQYVTTNGATQWANDEYYRMTDHPRDEDSQYDYSFLDVFIDEDRPKALNIWNRMIQGETKLSFELHLKRQFIPPVGDPEPASVLVHCIRVVEDGQFKSIMSFTSDVSPFKWAEASEARRAEAAEDDKKQQEEFIDFVSHELRNPLSAVFQLAETVMNSFPVPEGEEITTGELAQTIRDNIKSASTILMCAQHQKRIVDDVLTLSKLQYSMLSVIPHPVKFPYMVPTWMKMFDAQLVAADIKLELVPHPSLLESNIDWALCDESRVQQIFINLITNSIKFTKTESRREMKVEFGAVVTNPRDVFSEEVLWAPTNREYDDLTDEQEWGQGEQFYMTIAVTDTGIGMDENEIRKLFGRFEQANARTTIKYGGSGLGLYLCQRLTERMAGEIGVASYPTKGSTFVFYVKLRRAEEHHLLPPEKPPTSINLSSDPLLPQSTATGFAHMHVLLVEDNLVNQNVVTRLLQKAGCTVYTANHGQEALDILRRTDVWVKQGAGSETKHLDIILMDWEMPVMDGLTCTREIRKFQAEGKINRHVQIIATTANARGEQVEMALNSGLDSVISKPYLISDLLAMMRERLSIGDTAARREVMA